MINKTFDQEIQEQYEHNLRTDNVLRAVYERGRQAGLDENTMLKQAIAVLIDIKNQSHQEQLNMHLNSEVTPIFHAAIFDGIYDRSELKN